MTAQPAPSRSSSAAPRAALERSHPTVLGQLFELGRGDAFDWTSAERGGLLRHQLDLPLGPMGRSVPGSDGETASAPDGWEQRTHRELFAAADPPLGRLKFIKSRAKRGINADAGVGLGSGGEPDGVLPREVATVVYYAALAAARVHAGTSITQLDDAAFRTGLHWALDLAWVDEAVRGLLSAALAAAAADPNPAGQP